jgi:5'-deoxynucleotidase YfbR-like HD superfamily hydrolase
MKQNQPIKSRANYNKEFLNKTLKEIFSENISTKYTRYSPSHNKDLIEFLVNEKDETKKTIFNKIFILTFLDCLKHFRGSALYDELQGMDQLNKYLKETKNVEGDEEYCTIFNYFINNFESIIMEKKPRNRKSQNNN